jgi:tRNA-dihydrouridine synthase
METPWTYWDALGRPKYVASPMVDASEYAFRCLARKYGADLCFTPMLHAKSFVENKTYRKQRFDIVGMSTNQHRDRLLDSEGEGREDSAKLLVTDESGESNGVSSEGPTIAQLAGDDPDVLLSAAQIAAELGAAGVDLNCGCPMGIARKGHYGSALLRETDLIVAIIRRLSSSLLIPVSCKIRIIDNGGTDPNARGLEATLRLVDQIEAAGDTRAHFCNSLFLKVTMIVRNVGAACVTVHARNRLMTGKNTGAANWSAITAIKNRLTIPVVANGNIEKFEDIQRCTEVSKRLIANCLYFHQLVGSPDNWSGRCDVCRSTAGKSCIV